MMEPADELYGASSTVGSAVGDLDSAAFPESAGGWLYTVSARLTEGTNVQDAVADSVEFGIAEPGSSGEPARSGDPSVEPTTRPGGGSGGISGRGTPTTAAQATQAVQEERDAKETEAAADAGSRPRATSTSDVEQGDQSDPETEGQSGTGAATSDAGSGEGQDLTGDASGGVGDEPSVLPTWTVPANRSGGASAEQDSNVEPESEGGLNLGVLFLGILALVAIAYWLRRRM